MWISKLRCRQVGYVKNAEWDILYKIRWKQVRYTKYRCKQVASTKYRCKHVGDSKYQKKGYTKCRCRQVGYSKFRCRKVDRQVEYKKYCTTFSK
jgi:hypothetical protein